ncbi:MAG: insulinase family protein, partial [Candidatus Gastranaerophilales bacterium]|nr:insulinase family protein [Candidatus Gastranaerophilales bacterium]
MYNYENSYLRSFKGQAGSVKPPDKPNPRTADISNDVAVSQRNGIQTVTPDYNVSIPARYTKTGVETLSNGQEVHCYKLNNGQQVYIAPKESAGTILNTYVNTGSMNEKDSERGISHFCEHMAFNGTKGNDGYMKLGAGDVFRQVADMGGYTNASTNFAETNYTISAPLFNDDDFEKMVKIQASMMNNLEMSDNMVDKEHAPVTSEINMYSDMPDNIALNLAIKNLYNINTTSDDVVAGTVDNILNIDSKKVMDYYKNNYYPANMTTVVTGDVEPDEAIEIIAKNFRGENPKKPDRKNEPLKPIEKTIRKDIFSNKAVATTGFVCFNGPANNDFKDGMVINAINYYL